MSSVGSNPQRRCRGIDPGNRETSKGPSNGRNVTKAAGDSGVTPMKDQVLRLLKGEARALSRAISAVERGTVEAAEFMEAADGQTGRAYTVGVTGPPGAGKSTIVGGLTQLLREEGLTVGIVAVDPTSPFTGGALLGDRIRMQRHFLDDGVFIRSMATRGQSGGLPRIVKSIGRLLDASGKDVILVETVGVGQTELGIMGVADTVVVTLMPESGDAVQTLKAGIMEIADVYVVNKADREGASQMAAAITSMLRMTAGTMDWEPPVVMTQADAGKGIDELWERVKAHREFLTNTGGLESKRRARRRDEFLETVEEELGRRVRALARLDGSIQELVESVETGDSDPFSAATGLLESAEFARQWPKDHSSGQAAAGSKNES